MYAALAIIDSATQLKGPDGQALRTRVGIATGIVVIGAWGRPGDDTLGQLKSWNHGIQRIRCRIEKIFGTWKRSYGLRRMRWNGLAKATLQVRLTSIAYNFKRAAMIVKTATI